MSILSDDILNKNWLPKLSDLFEIYVAVQPRAIDKEKCKSLDIDGMDKFNKYFEELIKNTNVDVRWQSSLDHSIRTIIKDYIKTEPFNSGMERHLQINLKENNILGSGYRVTVTDATGIIYMMVGLKTKSDYYKNFHRLTIKFQ